MSDAGKYRYNNSEVTGRGDLLKNQAASGEMLSGAEIMVRALKAEGVDTVFGYPGGAVLALYDELYKSDIRHILTRHEQGAVHAADGYARATGRPGVVIATSGPGATNLVTGIANAHMDSVPIICITGQVSLDMVGRDSFQEADITGITIPITKYSYLIKDPCKVASTVREAFYIATTGRPGPVLIDFPKDMMVKKAEFRYPPELDLPGYRFRTRPNREMIREAARLLAESTRPVIVAGGGVAQAGAQRELLNLAERSGIPVATTMMGKGTIPEDHHLCLGMLGMHGTAYANFAVSSCDLLMALGARFDDRVTARVDTFAPRARIIHVDIDPAELGKIKSADISIAGDLRRVLMDLLAEFQPADYSAWRERVYRWREENPLAYDQNGSSLKPQYVIQRISDILAGDAIVTTDVGQHQMWAAQYVKRNKPRTFITSGGLGTMGFGLPAAMGVQVGCPDALVFCITGDGSIQMNSQELATVAHYRLPVKIAIINNGYLGMVRQWQELFFGARYAHSDISGGPDFVKLGDAYGIKAMRVTDRDGVEPALVEALGHQGPVMIDFVVEREENVFPMVPAGGSLNKMLGR